MQASPAQKVWTLEDCIRYAIDNNIQIKRQELQSEVAKNNLVQSEFNFLPDLNASGQHIIGKGPNPLNYSNNNITSSNGNISLASNFTLFNGFQKINNLQMNRYNYLSSIKNLEKAKNDISLNIASAYLQILSNNEILGVAKNQLELSQLQVDRTSKLVEVGNEALGSLLEIQAQAAEEEASLTEAQNQLNLSYFVLAQTLDLDTVKNFKVFIPSKLVVPESLDYNPDSIYKIAVNTLPEIKSNELQLKSSQYQLAVARGGRLPNIYLMGSLGSDYDLKSDTPINKQLNKAFYEQISLNLTVPLFNKYQVQKAISNAKINVRDNEYALRQSQLSLRKEIEQAYTDALGAFQNYKSRQKSVTANEENFNYVQQKFDVGLINSVDYNIAKNNYTKAKSDLIQAKYEFVFKIKILEFYKGNAIKL